MRALLVHGMGRTPLSMLVLGWRLRRAGILPQWFSYFAGYESFAAIAARLSRRLAALARKTYVAVGHSLGGLLLRTAIARLPLSVLPPRHLICLGTPNRTSRLARALRNWPPYRLFNGDSGQLLGDAARMDALPRPNVSITLVAGTRASCN